ncbi:MAG: hypothetical protein P9M14_11865 [Candidatus Alcyoniella australis]|nr:hypothetical protein [Candidatus Alcyoniella australis]
MSRQLKRALTISILLTLAIAATAGAEQTYPPGTVLAGAAEYDITPEVALYEDLNGDGEFSMGDPSLPFGLGDRVKSFAYDNDQINVGNGNGAALYIYDRLWAHALVLRDVDKGTTVAILTSDLYLLTNADVQEIRDRVDPELGIDYILVTATHNHMGPDTLGLSGLNNVTPGEVLKIAYTDAEATSGINPDYFESFINISARTIEDATRNLVPARLTFAQTKFNFGLSDLREPLIIDDTLSVMAVDSLDRRPIATLLSWACHPEAVLTYAGKRTNVDLTQLDEQQIAAWGKVFSAGFPGYACRYVSERRGGVTLYANGPLGGLITNLWTYVWDPELHPEYPADVDPASVPEELRIPNDFRFAAVQGRELAKAALMALLRNGEIANEASVEYKRAYVLVPMQNPVMRLAGSLGILGYKPGSFYDDDWQIDNSSAPWLSGMFLPGVDVHHGKNLRTEVATLRIGPAQIAAVPAELLPELSLGLPDDFIENQERYYPHDADKHASGEKLVLSYPALKQQMDAKYKMVFCLANDNLGYVIPRVDFKPPHDLKIPPLAWWWICFDSDNNPHYEESNSVSREIEPALMGALTRLLSPEYFEPEISESEDDQNQGQPSGEDEGGDDRP